MSATGSRHIIKEMERSGSGHIDVVLPPKVYYTYKKLLIEKKMSLAYFNERVKIFVIEYLNSVLKKYSHTELDVTELLKPYFVVRNSLADNYFMANANVKTLHIKHRIQKFEEAVQRAKELYPGIDVACIEDKYDKIITEFYMPTMAEELKKELKEKQIKTLGEADGDK